MKKGRETKSHITEAKLSDQIPSNRTNRLLKNVWLGLIPIGRLLNWRSNLSSDPITQAGISEMEEILTNKDHGMAVFFAHLETLDPFGTISAMEKELPIFEALLPAAASWHSFPFLLKPIFRSLEKQVQHKIVPVYRKEELGYTKRPFLDFSGLSPEEKKQANKVYGELVRETLQKEGGLVMLAPYAGRAPHREHLRSGPLALAQSGVEIIFTLTLMRKLKYVVYFSKVYKFSEDITTDELHEVMYQEYARMAELNNMSEAEMLSSKDTAKTTKILWGFVFFILSLYLARSARRALRNKRSHQVKGQTDDSTTHLNPED
jgi:hypothetical protein